MKVSTIAVAALLTVSSGLLKADVLAYLSQSNDQFGTLDLTTGVYTNIGNMGQLLAGLGTFGGGIYGGTIGGAIEEVNTATAALTPITTTGATPSGGWRAFGSTTTDLYGLDATGELYSINPATGVVAAIGQTGLSGDFSTFNGTSADAGSLYFTTNSKIYTINTSTGTPTLLNGNDGTNDIGALAFEDGTLYAGSGAFPHQSVVTVNTSTGETSQGPAIMGNSGGFYGLAAVESASAPEPATLSMFLCLAGALFVFGRISGRRQKA